MMTPCPRILIVEDDEAQRNALRRPLTAEGYQCEELSKGGVALERARQVLPDLIVLDAQLRDVSGLEVCRQLKADPLLASTPILQLSAAESAPEAKARGLAAGADCYLTPPIQTPVFLAHVQALLRLRSTELARRQSAELLAEVLQDMSDAFVALDPDGRITHFNRQALGPGGDGEERLERLPRGARVRVPQAVRGGPPRTPPG